MNFQCVCVCAPLPGLILCLEHHFYFCNNYDTLHVLCTPLKDLNTFMHQAGDITYANSHRTRVGEVLELFPRHILIHISESLLKHTEHVMETRGFVPPLLLYHSAMNFICHHLSNRMCNIE